MHKRVLPSLYMFVLAILIANIPTFAKRGIVQDSLALVELYRANPSMRVNWKKGLRISKWDHIGAANYSDGYRVDSLYIELNGKPLLLTDALSKITRLRALKINNANLGLIPEQIYATENLRHLILTNCRIREIGSDIKNLTHLAMLDLRHNRLKELPVELSTLVHLYRLQLDNNELMTIPDWIKVYRYLRELTLSHNNLTQLSMKVVTLPKLEKLDISHNSLLYLPRHIGVCRSLLRLDASHNRLDSVTHSIGKLDSLQELDLSFNMLRTLPEEIRQCTSLTTLNISGNVGLMPETALLTWTKAQEVKLHRWDTLTTAAIKKTEEPKLVANTFDQRFPVKKSVHKPVKSNTKPKVYEELPPKWIDREDIDIDFEPFFSGTHFGGNTLHYSMELAFTLQADIDVYYGKRRRKGYEFIGAEVFVEPGIEGIRGGGGINFFPIDNDYKFNQLSVHFQGTYFWEDRDHDGLSGKSFIGPEFGFEFFGSFKFAILKEFQGDKTLYSFQGGFHFPITWLAKAW